MQMFGCLSLTKLILLAVFGRFLGKLEQLIDILTHFADFYAVFVFEFLKLLKCVSMA
jgi:hypothetical protein